jgi:hypothetical protein
VHGGVCVLLGVFGHVTRLVGHLLGGIGGRLAGMCRRIARGNLGIGSGRCTGVGGTVQGRLYIGRGAFGGGSRFIGGIAGGSRSLVYGNTGGFAGAVGRLGGIGTRLFGFRALAGHQGQQQGGGHQRGGDRTNLHGVLRQVSGTLILFTLP